MFPLEDFLLNLEELPFGVFNVSTSLYFKNGKYLYRTNHAINWPTKFNLA